MRPLPRAPLSSSLVGLPERPTLARYLDFWLAHHAWAHLRFTTARTYASVTLHTITPVLGRVRVRSLSPDKLEKAKLVWQRAGVKTSMIRKAIEVLRSALRHAVELGLCETNPASRTRVPPKSERPVSWLDVDDARRMLASVEGTRWEALYALALGLGLRRGELTGLTWADVDLGARVVRIRWTRSERRGSPHGTGERAGELSHAALIELARRSLRARARAAPQHAQPRNARSSGEKRRSPIGSLLGGLLFTDPRRGGWRREKTGSPFGRLREPSSQVVVPRFNSFSAENPVRTAGCAAWTGEAEKRYPMHRPHRCHRAERW